MNLIYGINDKPRFGQVVLFAIQQLLAIMAATIAVPAVINSVFGFMADDAGTVNVLKGTAVNTASIEIIIILFIF